jgi:FtsH-binding integral membrane protein
MAQGWGNQAYSPRALDQAAYDVGLRQYMLSIYNYMAGGLAVTGLVSYLVASSPEAMHAIFGTPLQWVVMLAPLGFVLFFSARIGKMSLGAAQITFWLFAASMGLSLASIFYIYTGTSIARVFFVTAAAFAGTSLYGYTTKTDLSRFGSFLIMGLIGVILASLVNIFLASSALQFAISVIGVLVFTGLTAYDTQRLKELYAESYDQASMGKLVISGALTLYLDFINLFMLLLQLFGDRRQ